MTKKVYTLLLIAASPAVLASGNVDYHYTDIIHPMINFIVLFGFIGWKIKTSISQAFTRNSEEVASLYTIAEQKDKEAEIKLQMFRKKLDEIESTKRKIFDNSMNDLKKFETTYQKEVEDIKARMKNDTDNRIESERKEQIMKLNATLLDQVIMKTKSAISSNEESRKKVTEKLLARVDQ